MSPNATSRHLLCVILYYKLLLTIRFLNQACLSGLTSAHAQDGFGLLWKAGLSTTGLASGSLQVTVIKESASKLCLLLFDFLFSPDSPGLDASCMGKGKGRRQPRVVVGRGEAGHGFA